MCPHTAKCVGYYYTCVRNTTIYFSQIPLYVSAYYYICPHTTTCVSSYYDICVLILRYMCPHTTTCVRILLYTCPHTSTCVLIHHAPGGGGAGVRQKKLKKNCAPRIPLIPKHIAGYHVYLASSYCYTCPHASHTCPHTSNNTTYLSSDTDGGRLTYAHVCSRMLTYADVC